MNYGLKATDIKSMLKARGLPLSGRKEELIDRLVLAAENEVSDVVAGTVVFVCSEKGKQLAKDYWDKEDEYKRNVECAAVEYLKRKKFREASLAIAAYEAERVFPRGINVNWGKYDPARDVETLKCIFTGKPKILSFLADEKMADLRLAAGIISLLGEAHGTDWLPADFETGSTMSKDVAVRMLSFYARHQATLADYRRHGVVKEVEVLPAKDCCEECRKLAGRRFKITETPELPYERCKHEKGCRCTFIPINR